MRFLDDASIARRPAASWEWISHRVYAGTLYPYDATALDDFAGRAMDPADGVDADARDVNPKMSRILDGALLRQSSWDAAKGARPADPVSAVLMQDQLLNYFVLDAGTASGTDWIVTMPTKPNYVNVVGAVAPPPSPFESSFNAGGAPDSFNFKVISCQPQVIRGNTIDFDREGFGPVEAPGCPGVPPGPPPPFALPWTSNVVIFNTSNVLASSASIDYRTLRANGWLRLAPFPNASPSPAHKLVSTDSPPVIYYGLPMIGFMANSYYNGAIPNPSGSGSLLSAYGATSPHKGVTRIE